MSRFILVDTDGSSIVTILTMSESDALSNVQLGQTLLSINPLTDNGASIKGSVIFDNGTNSLIDTKTGLPLPSMEGISLSIVT